MSLAFPIRGAIWPQDQWGRVLNAAADRYDLRATWSCLSEEVVDLAFDRFGSDLHSVYLSGPAARNRPGGGSFIIVLDADASATPSTDNWTTAAANDVRTRVKVYDGVRISVLRWRDLFCPLGGFSPAKFRLAVNSVCVGGRDLGRLITPQKIDTSIANTFIVSLEERLASAKRKTMVSDSAVRMQALSAEVGHAVVSAGYATVLIDEQTYTEDLDLRRDILTLHYPELKDEVQRAYDMAALPGSDPIAIRRFINSSLLWMRPMIDDWLNQHNPERLELIQQ